MSIEPEEELAPESPASDETAVNPTLSQRFSDMPNKPVLFGAAGVAILVGLGACVICVLALLLLQEFRNDNPPAVTEEPTVTPLAAVPTSQPQIVGVSGSGTISVTLGTPLLLRLGEQEFDVVADIIGADGVWAPDLSNESQATWISGTIINYVLGLADTEANEALLSQLAPGDEIQLITNGRTSFTFNFAERNLVPVNDTSIYTQQAPGITLILLSADGNERLVVRGPARSSEIESEPANVVEIGDTAQLDNYQITPNSAIYIADRAEIPAGFAFFQVEYAIQNVGLTALDTSNLKLTLVDELGNEYALNPAASQSGNYPVLNGFLNANQVMNATAGYQVPLGLDSETVNWVVTNQETGAQAIIQLPFTGGETAEQGASISVFRAEVSPDLTGLNLGGQITNLGTQPLVVSASDVELRTPDGAVYLLLSTNPPLPWTVAPGATVQFFLSYQRPSGGNAVFRVLNQEFQITEQP
jgi:hypothetical protein